MFINFIELKDLTFLYIGYTFIINKKISLKNIFYFCQFSFRHEEN